MRVLLAGSPDSNDTIMLGGLNHKTAGIELREDLVFSEDQTVLLLKKLQQHPVISEVILFSTCNRIEVLLAVSNSVAAWQAVKNGLAQDRHIHQEQLEAAFYMHTGAEAARHLFRVGASLDSMMVGEPQILGQVKKAFGLAVRAGTSGMILNRLMHQTFRTAKRVRTETGIGDHAVSISYAAIELGRKIFGTLENKEVLLIGAGEMAELAVEHLINNRVASIYVANRTFERGLELAGRFKGTPVRFEEISVYLEFVDIVISSTGAAGLVVHQDQIKACLRKRKNKPLFFIDIAVPRDIDPRINRIRNNFVYDIDDLNGVVEENLSDRRQEAVKAGHIIDEAVVNYRSWYKNLAVVPTIKALKAKLNQISNSETRKTLQNLRLAPHDRDAIMRMTAAINRKILHDPILFLKNNQNTDLVHQLFNLNERP